MNDSAGKYYVKNTSSGSYEDITTKFGGVAILKADGFLELGKPVNVYNEQWVNSQAEDMCITTGNNGTPVIIRENVDISLTFIIRQKYTSSSISVSNVHDTFISYMTGTDVWIKSTYAGKAVHCICMSEYKPTTVMLNRGNNSYIMGTLTFHTLDKPSSV